MYNIVVVFLFTCFELSVVNGVEHTFNHDTNDDYKICDREVCVRKCCPENHIIMRKKCVKSADHNFTVTVFDGTEKVNDSVHYHVIHDDFCAEGEPIALSPASIPEDIHYLQRNGSLYLPHAFDIVMAPFREFCIEKYLRRNRSRTITKLCLRNIVPIVDSVPSRGMIISMPFLLATFIAYALLPDRNLHMKALMFYVITLMLSYLLLVIVQLSESSFDITPCTMIGYSCLFFFLVSFFWMNVICVDIWFAFSGLRGFTGSKSSAEMKRFIMYCVYAWGMPILHVIVVFAIDKLSQKNAWYSPGIGNGQCFLRRGWPELFYFYGPMAILITINVGLFAVTAIKIRSVKKDTSMLKKEDSKRHSYENDKQTFNLYLKLLFAMGVNWSMEIISWAVIWSGKGPEAIWYLTDFCNAIYGVFIFFIFVFKRNIWKLLKKRYYSFIGKPHLAHSMTTSTNTTRTTSYSTAVPMSENPHGHETNTLTSEA